VSRDLLLTFWDPYISREPLKLENSNLVRRSKMPITVTINRSNGTGGIIQIWRRRLCPFLKLEVVLTQPWIEQSYRKSVWRYIWTLLNECCY